ncbi:BadF/BadG/BcrA/BcrD ATPase family protein [Nakamurella aerolata]|uniref:ATPase n=1 Tax=Nakamurella aerolata TaxID=1656892 RepID=A0A849A6H8_9ACTN|nr:BadF/BadG/BcrA/BcrD ATPase family protein [Nakamurella aerolata]NNG35647.1 ATPase [Nakamurella aerolata]
MSESPTVVLVVDLGKTSCRVSYRVSGVPTGESEPRVETGPGTPGLAEPDGAAAAVAAIDAPVRRLWSGGAPPPGLDDRVAADATTLLAVGAAGALAAPTAAAELAAGLLGAWPELAVRSAAVTSDALTAHLGALAGAAGVVLVAGTGATAVGVGTAGSVAVSGGWGPVLGDEGSGGWIGAAGLRAALRDLDGRGPRTGLRAAAEAMFGALQQLPRAVSDDGAPARATARFAGTVDDAAAQGDRVAADIIDHAAGELAAAAAAAAERVGADADHPLDVSVVGGLVGLPTLAAGLRRRLAAEGSALRQVASAGSALDGAALLMARGPALPHEPHVHRAGVS